MRKQTRDPRFVYMITRDNERTLERALASVTWTDEIVVVDSSAPINPGNLPEIYGQSDSETVAGVS